MPLLATLCAFIVYLAALSVLHYSGGLDLIGVAVITSIHLFLRWFFMTLFLKKSRFA